MKKLIQASCLAFLVVGCQNKQGQELSTRFHDDGRGKAIVTITPIFDEQNIQLPWSLSQDLTEMIKVKLMKKANVFVTKEASDVVEGLSFEGEIKPNPLEENQLFYISSHSLKEKFPKTEFVVFMELAEHKLISRVETGGFLDTVSPSYELHEAIRLRIYDLRSETPTIVLQELVEQTHPIPKSFVKMDYDSTLWGKKTYSITPLGLAHSQLVKDVTSRIENYLILAKTK